MSAAIREDWPGQSPGSHKSAFRADAVQGAWLHQARGCTALRIACSRQINEGISWGKLLKRRLHRPRLHSCLGISLQSLSYQAPVRFGEVYRSPMMRLLALLRCSLLVAPAAKPRGQSAAKALIVVQACASFTKCFVCRRFMLWHLTLALTLMPKLLLACYGS